MSKISKDEVAKIAALARLDLSNSESEKFQAELSGILSYVETIQKVNTENIEPTAQVTGLTDVVRDDVKVQSKVKRDKFLQNAPEKKEGYIKVKPILRELI